MASPTRQYPKLAYSRNTPDTVKAVLDKLVDEPGAPRKQRQKQHLNVSRDLFEKISQATGQDAIDSSSVFQLLPDVELTEQILVGSILSPKDMTTADLNFTVAEQMFDSEAARPLLGVVEKYFKHGYKIDERLDAMLEDILFKKGAYILAVLPENNLDMIINGDQRVSAEQFQAAVQRVQDRRPLGFLGHPREERVSMESFRDRTGDVAKVIGHLPGSRRAQAVTIPGLEVTDNFNLLKTSNILHRQRSQRIAQVLNRHQVSMESASKGLTSEEIDQLYGRPRPKAQHTQVLHSQQYLDRPSVGHPLVMRLPIESVIPVHVPGEVDNHVGYFVMLDNGRPLVRDTRKDYYGELRNSFKANSQDNSSELVRLTREAMGATSSSGMQEEYDQIQKAYATIIENDLLNRLRNGIYGEDFELGITDDVYQIMLYRALKAQHTQLLYLPAELVVYMAFDYNEHGIGQTLLTQSKILSSMRAVLLFAETMQGVRNAIGRKRASITIDEDDPDPEKTISDVQAMILESAHRGFPLASPDPAQTLDYLHRAGFDFNINVEGGGYPGTKVEFDDWQSSAQGGNPELSDRLRRMHISGFGINPDLVDPTSSPDFAVSVVTNNLIMTRRVMRYQKRFTKFLTRFSQIFTMHSSLLREELAQVLKENKAKLGPDLKGLSEEQIIDRFIQAIETTLPHPDTTRVDLQLQAFEQYSTLLDRAIEAYITEDLFPPEVLAREPDAMRLVESTIRAYYKRLWLEQNNVMPELDVLTEMDGRKPVFNLLDIQKGHLNSLGNAIQKYLDGVAKMREKWEKKNQGTDDQDGFGGSHGGFDESGEAESAAGGGEEEMDNLGEEEGLDELDEVDELPKEEVEMEEEEIGDGSVGDADEE